MFWIHGGAWYMGSGNGETEIYGPELIMNKDVVLVTINYRLGPFGNKFCQNEMKFRSNVTRQAS
jgi:carboxylesterase type B